MCWWHHSASPQFSWDFHWIKLKLCGHERRERFQGKTGIAREVGNDSLFHLPPSLAGCWRKDRAGRVLHARRDTQKRSTNEARLLKTETVLGEQTQMVCKLKISSSKWKKKRKKKGD